MADSRIPTTRIAPSPRPHGVLALGCWQFGADYWAHQSDPDSLAAMAAALDAGMNHFDTAEGYGREAHSEKLVGQFLQGKRDRVFLATKLFPNELDPAATLRKVDASRQRLGVDVVDLFYIHWPRQGQDIRPVMEGLETARQQGKIHAIGVSNFSVADMEQASEAGRIDAHQLCYNLFWRVHETDVIPWCNAHNIAVVTYSSIAQGVLTGKFPREVSFPEGDGRKKIAYFREGVWPHVHAGVEQLKALATELNRPLVDLAIRWVVQRPDIDEVIVGSRNAGQVAANAAAFDGEIPQSALDRMTAISDDVIRRLPQDDNLWGFHP